MPTGQARPSANGVVRSRPVRRPNVNTAVAVGVFVVSNCMEHRPAKAPEPAPRPEPPSAEAPSTPDSPPFQKGFATYYARRFAGRRTANGERYNPLDLSAAHRTLPFGTMIEVRRVDGDARRVVVRVNDRGPYVSNRIIDLSRRAAEQLGIVHDGKALVELRTVNGPPVASRGED
jgi:rare lipoprotein A